MKFYWGIRRKLLVITILTVLPLLAGAVWITTRLVERSFAKQAFILESATLDRVTSRLDFLSKMATSDVVFLSRLPSLVGLAKAHEGHGFDPKSGLSLEELYTETLDSLKGFMSSKLVYDQARLLDPEGQEVIRVDLVEGSPREIPVPVLQAKGGRYYFQESSKLPAGRVYVSYLDLNREEGVVEEPHKPVLRFATPLRGPQDQLLGVVVLNFFGHRMMKEALAKVLATGDGQWLLMDSQGFFIHHPQRPDLLWGSPRDLNTGLGCVQEFGQACPDILSGRKASVRLGGRTWDSYSAVMAFSGEDDKNLVVVHLVQPPPLTEYLSQFGLALLMVSVFALAAAVLFAWLSGQMVVHPLTRLAKTMERFSQKDWSVRSDLHSNDELGLLAQGFNDMAGRLEGLYTDLESQVAGRTAELEKANLSLTHSEAKARAILDGTVDAIITMDTQGVVQSFNKGAEKIFGYSAQEVVGHKINMLQPENVASNHDRYLKNYLETGEARIIGQGREEYGRRKDGTEFPMYLAVSEVRVGESLFFTGIIRDITDLRATEDSLRESQRMYRSLTEAAPVGIFYTDPQGKCSFVNEQWSTIAGMSEEEALGDGWARSIHPDDREMVWNEWARTTGRGQPFEAEYRFQRPDGEVLWVYGRAVAHQSTKGELLGYLGTITDISERRKAEEDNLILGRILEDSTNEIYIFDLETLRFHQVNRGARENLGYTMEELRGMTPLDIKPEFTPERFEEEVAPLRDGTKQRVEFSTVHRRKDGRVYPVQVYLQKTDRETVPVFVAIIQDVTEVRKAEQELRQQAQIIDQTHDAVISIDLGGRITSWNRGAAELFGYAREEALDQNLSMLNPEEDAPRLKELIFEPLSREGKLELELKLRKKSGREFTVLLSLSELTSLLGKPVGFVVFAVDISARKAAEEAVRRAKEAAEEANRIKSGFLASMSHELRTPLNAIIGFSEILMDQTFGDLNAKQSRQVGHILDSGRHLLSLINDILDLSKVESGKMELDLSVVNLAALLDSSLVLIREKAVKHGIALNLELPPELREMNFSTDERKFKQVMFNLLSNAAKFTPDQGEITVTASREGQELTLRVRDTGIGIDLRDQKRIFNEFEQVDNTYSRRQEGTGLGLALTRQLVELLGGTIRVESGGRDQGSVFSFTIPLETAPKTETGRKDREGEPFFEEPADLPPDVLTVLVIDDDPLSLELLTGFLQEGGFRVLTAASGTEGLRLAKSRKPDAISLDILLPDLSGFEILRQLQEDPVTSGIPVVMVSITDDKEKGLRLGATDFIQKPVSKKVLLNSLSDLIAQEPKGFDKVLVVDDNPTDLELVESILSCQKCEVLVARGGAEGIETALRERPDLIILDLNMPGISGWEVMRTLRERAVGWYPPILVFTSTVLSAQERRQLAGMVQAVVLKGGGKDDLLQEIRRLTQMTFEGE